MNDDRPWDDILCRHGDVWRIDVGFCLHCGLIVIGADSDNCPCGAEYSPVRWVTVGAPFGAVGLFKPEELDTDIRHNTCEACKEDFRYLLDDFDLPERCPSCRHVLKNDAVVLEKALPEDDRVNLVPIDEPGQQRSYVNPKLVAIVSPERGDAENLDGRCRVTMANGESLIAVESPFHVVTKLTGEQPTHSVYTGTPVGPASELS